MWRQQRTLCVLTLLCISAIPVWGQFRGAVTGTITDSSGGIIPGVSVALTSEETQRKLETKSNESGTYTFTSLAPGKYRVSATQKGFKETSVEVTVNAEAAQSVNVTMEPGELAQTVTVVADTSPAVDTNDANLGRAITNQEILRLPQVGRDPYELIRLTPGIFGDGARSGGGNAVKFPNNSAGPGGSNVSLFQTENQLPFSAAGQRLTANNYMIDGVSVNSLQWGGAAVVTPNQESVKEMRVNANAYSAQYGRNSGAQIEVVSQNGTNQFHGTGVFKYDNPGFNAFQKYGGVDAPVQRVENAFRNYAASLGGPVLKNRLFFFFSFEGLRNKTVTFANSYVETPQFDQAIVANRPNSLAARVINSPGNTPRIAGQIPLTVCPAGFSPCQVVNGALDIGSITGAPGVYTNGTSGGGLDGIPDVQNVQLAVPTSQTGQQYNGRIDWSHGNNYLAGSTYFTFLDQTGGDSGAASRPNADTHTTPLNADITVIYTRTLSPSMLNEARANFTRFNFNSLKSSGLTNYGIPALQLQGLPFVNNIQYGASQGDTSPAAFAQNTYEFRDTFSKVTGNQTIRAGVEVRREQDNNNLAGSARPIYTFSNPWDFPNDAPVYEGILADPRTGAPSPAQRYYRTNLYALFVQDDWKLSPNFTLNLGLRWEYFTSPTEKRGQLWNLFPGPGLGNYADASLQHVGELYHPDRNNFAPRVGFAYNPRKAPWFVMRAGFGVFFNRTQDALFALTREDVPGFSRFNICCGSNSSPLVDGKILYSLGASNSIFSYPTNPLIATGINPVTNTPNGTGIEVYTVPQNFATPYVYSYSFSTDFKLPQDFLLSLSYQGSSSHKLIRIANYSFLYPSAANNPNYSPIYYVEPDVNANYNALVASFSRRFANGFQFQNNFRWAKSLDKNSFEGPGADTNPTYPQDMHQEYGPSDFDVKYTNTLSGLYELPFFRSQKGLIGKILGGFRVDGTFTFRTGFPWTPKSGQSVQTPGGPSLSPVRPIQYLGGAFTGQSNDAFMRDGGNFPNGPSSYFVTQLPSGVTTLPPGIGRNVFRGPWYKSFDFGIAKSVKFPNRFLGEATQLDMRVNLFNAFNQLNLAPFNFYDSSTFVDNPQFFGRPISALAGRVVELQARFSF